MRRIELGVDADEFARIVSELLRAERALGAAGGERSLGCLWSALDGCACGASIPEATVAGAWERELDAGGEREDRFFHFIWEGGVWLAYGLARGERPRRALPFAQQRARGALARGELRRRPRRR